MYVCRHAAKYITGQEKKEEAQAERGTTKEWNNNKERKNGILTLFMIMNARQHIYVKIMQFAAVLCQCVEWLKGDRA